VSPDRVTETRARANACSDFGVIVPPVVSSDVAACSESTSIETALAVAAYSPTATVC
jgi:hypothetical protein